MNKLKIAATVALTLASVTALAQSNNDSGFYGLGQFGTTKNTEKFTNTDGGSGDSESQGNGWMLGLGYDFDKNFAFEGSYGQFYKAVNVDNYHNANSSYINNKSNKTNATGFVFTALAKMQASENVRLFAGPSLMLLKVKGDYSSQYKSGSTNYTDAGGNSFSKNIPGLTVGAAFALDTKTDLRVTYNMMKETEFPSDSAGVTSKAKLSTMLFGLAIKF
jgi:Outer membrane protein beta-barrel domain